MSLSGPKLFVQLLRCKGARKLSSERALKPHGSICHHADKCPVNRVPLRVFRGLSEVVVAPAGANGGQQMLSPAVRYLVSTHGIADTSVIRRSGPHNRLLKG